LKLTASVAAKIAKDGENGALTEPESTGNDSGSTATESSDSCPYEPLENVGNLPTRTLEILQAVESLISSLQRLSMAIRRASKQARSGKIARFELRSQADLTLRADLEVHASWLMELRYPNADERVRMHLCAAILVRQKRFLYRKSRRAKIQAPNFAAGTQISAETASISMTPASVSSPQNQRPLPQQVTKSEAGKSIATSQNTAAAFDEKKFDIDAMQPKKPAMSVRSLRQDKNLDWPPPPRFPPGIFEIECPYCFDFLTKNELSSLDVWKYGAAHVPLFPYSHSSQPYF
jgi:hypothetical protein